MAPPSWLSLGVSRPPCHELKYVQGTVEVIGWSPKLGWHLFSGIGSEVAIWGGPLSHSHTEQASHPQGSNQAGLGPKPFNPIWPLSCELLGPILPQCATSWGLVSTSWHHYFSSSQNSRPSPRSLPPPAPPPDWPCRLETKVALLLLQRWSHAQDTTAPTPLCSLLSVTNVTMTSTKQHWSEETLFIRMNHTQKKDELMPRIPLTSLCCLLSLQWSHTLCKSEPLEEVIYYKFCFLSSVGAFQDILMKFHHVMKTAWFQSAIVATHPPLNHKSAKILSQEIIWDLLPPSFEKFFHNKQWYFLLQHSPYH